MKQVRITEGLLKDGTNTYVKDDVKTMDDATANRFISAGWAEDVLTGERGERKPGANGPIEIQPIRQRNK